ncbi:hypothetical protein PF005_g18420 [Phytophthora fragariae]|uniref:Uncharacterized protein n=1 Tax=Phytophthora fragariae TaxID=53985 RepID=A0A6A3RET3_9STRA|nr:hypothetical protein PF003_g9125 [Phytophthora fragariae]KAE8930514.1 hypothetical protein PF009_g19397 [Phytophthora fragariae]KAE9094219.1 hypothetical protein PF007_g17829 [Phytophthora fragariae]KAE9135747.1 hypothetical protein PF006_g14539 [Phytophthora fragariae]KAE9192529.1 hypothetical protein PF005_g18420 [Phytophthora fragariae]
MRTGGAWHARVTVIMCGLFPYHPRWGSCCSNFVHLSPGASSHYHYKTAILMLY